MDDRRQLLAKLLDFKSMQEERARQFRKLDEDHKAYLATAPDYNLASYKVAVHEATEKFKKICQSIALLKGEMPLHKGAEGCSSPIDLIDKVQALEESRLRTVVDLQLAKQQAQDDPEDELLDKNVKGILKSLHATTEGINEAMEELKYLMHDLADDEDQSATR